MYFTIIDMHYTCSELSYYIIKLKRIKFIGDHFSINIYYLAKMNVTNRIGS